MKYLKIAFFVILFSSIRPSSVFAQSTLQNTGSGIQNSSNTQQTNLDLQNNTQATVPTNQINTSVLGVQSSPSQQEPSVVINGNDTRTQTTQKPKEYSAKPYLLTFFIIIGFLSLIYWLFRKYYLNRRSHTLEPNSESSIIDQPNIETTHQKSKQKKKSKKAHR